MILIALCLKCCINGDLMVILEFDYVHENFSACTNDTVTRRKKLHWFPRNLLPGT